MIYNQGHEPRHAGIGDVWTDGQSFKRVLSRGRSWENVNLGSTHPDEVNHDEQERKRAAAEQQRQGVQVPGPDDGEPTEDLRIDGEDSVPAGEGRRQESAQVANESEPAGHETNADVAKDGEPLTSTGPIADPDPTEQTGEQVSRQRDAKRP